MPVCQKQISIRVALQRYVQEARLLTKQQLDVDRVDSGLRYRAMHSKPNAGEEWEALYPESNFARAQR